MRKIIVIIISVIFFSDLKGQVGIGTTTPNSSAALEINDTTRGLLIPRMTMSNRLSISNPATGLMIYQTDSSSGFWFYTGNKWGSVSTSLSDSANSSGQVRISTTKNGSMIVVYTTTTAYGFARSVAGTPTWYGQSLSGPGIRAIATDSSIVLYTPTEAYGFTRSAAGTPTWYAQTLNGTPVGIASSGKIIVVSTTTESYGFTKSNAGTPTWYGLSLSGTPVGIIGRDSNGDDCVVVYTSLSAYGFTRSAAGTPTWYSQTLAGTPVGGTSSGNLIVVYTSLNGYGFTRSGAGTPSWYGQTLSGVPIGVSPE
jgi:hypothetical protein